MSKMRGTRMALLGWTVLGGGVGVCAVGHIAVWQCPLNFEKAIEDWVHSAPSNIERAWDLRHKPVQVLRRTPSISKLFIELQASQSAFAAGQDQDLRLCR